MVIAVDNTGVEGVLGANGEDPLIFMTEKKKGKKKKVGINLKRASPSPQRTKSHNSKDNIAYLSVQKNAL